MTEPSYREIWFHDSSLRELDLDAQAGRLRVRLAHAPAWPVGDAGGAHREVDLELWADGPDRLSVVDVAVPDTVVFGRVMRGGSEATLVELIGASPRPVDDVELVLVPRGQSRSTLARSRWRRRPAPRDGAVPRARILRSCPNRAASPTSSFRTVAPKESS